MHAELFQTLPRTDLPAGGRYDLSSDYRDSVLPSDIGEVKRIIKDLVAVDWAFADEDTGFLTHDLHPYPAKFIPHLPGYLISRLSLPGDLIFDPFGGSGTTALEAVRLRRRAISLDANPLSAMIGEGKTARLDHQARLELKGLHAALATKHFSSRSDASDLIKANAKYVPEIPNIEKWFAPAAIGELALIRASVMRLESGASQKVARLALSRIILRSSFQDSETRYTSKPRAVAVGETLTRFLTSLREVCEEVAGAQDAVRYGVCEFLTADFRSTSLIKPEAESVDLVVTSPPYGNAMDYHLYHRFRLLWLGFDPKAFAAVEVGSHLRHQREKTGFQNYQEEMALCLLNVSKVLRPGRFAALVVGDCMYEGRIYPGAESLIEPAKKAGLLQLCIIRRDLPRTKRSFVAAGRRAVTENILVLQKPDRKVTVQFPLLPYKPWPYEQSLRIDELKSVVGTTFKVGSSGVVTAECFASVLPSVKRLTFTHEFQSSGGRPDKTWQAILENGWATNSGARKDPKYVTHGIHPYKGKFYPQLAKALLNLVSTSRPLQVVDPFCGSGTTLLEGYLNGHRAYGCDMNPLGALIAKAKVGILNESPELVEEAMEALQGELKLQRRLTTPDWSVFPEGCRQEIESWFPGPVIVKMSRILGVIRRVSSGDVRAFFEVILSSLIREVSQQEPTDLRVRRRKIPLQDADVYELFGQALERQYERVRKFWLARGYSPVNFQPAAVTCGDSREMDPFKGMGLSANTVDLVLTSPPYAMALPYIDTDRLSLLTILGLPSPSRRPLEQDLIGSREIRISQKNQLEAEIGRANSRLPAPVAKFTRELLHKLNGTDEGFRRQNMPALLTRFFVGMESVLRNSFRLLKSKGEAMFVIGDSRMEIDGREVLIPNTRLIEDIAHQVGFHTLGSIDISVTTEGMVHLRNAIKQNVVLRLRKP